MIHTKHSIYGLYGLPGVSVYQFHTMCSSLQRSYAIATPSGLERHLFENSSYPYPVLVQSVANFWRVFRRFKKPVCVFVIDNPIHLLSYNAVLLGAHQVKKFQFSFSSVRATDIDLAIESCPNSPVPISRGPISVINAILETTDSSSSLSVLQTALYKIRDQAIRKTFQESMYKYLAGQLSLKRVHLSIRGKLDEEFATKLLSILSRPDYQALRDAAQEVFRTRSAATNWERVSKRYKVSRFDLKYVCKKVATLQGNPFKE